MWVIVHGVLGSIAVAFLVLALTLVLWWRHGIHLAIEKKIDVKVTREECCQISKSVGGMLEYLEIDSDAACRDFPELSIISLGRYMSSLQAHGTVSLQGALISILHNKGLHVALPLALFTPERWRRESQVLDAFAGTPYAALMLSNALSTLGLLTVSTLAHRYSIDLARSLTLAPKLATKADTLTEQQPNKSRARFSALDLMVHGSNPSTDNGLHSRISNPFTLPQDIGIAAGLGDSEENHDPSRPFHHHASRSPAPSPVHPLFPDLHLGNGGLSMLADSPQREINSVAASLFNRLASNSLLGLIGGDGAPNERFVVRIATRKEEVVEVVSVEGLLKVLQASGHTITMRLSSNLTSFGVGMCVQEEAIASEPRWIQVPIVYPVLTGMFCKDAMGNDSEATTIMAHAALYLTINGPLLSCSLEWCLSIAGFTGWLPRNGVDRPWQLSSVNLHSEGALDSFDNVIKAVRLTTTSAAVLNVAATRGQMMFGGYGFLGVCIDSVAAIQKAMTGDCTLYPLILGGDAKMRLLHWYRSLQQSAKDIKAGQGYSWEYDAEASMLRSAIASLPCDGIIEPGQIGPTVRRALACLPSRSIFLGVEKCRQSLEAAQKMAQEQKDI